MAIVANFYFKYWAMLSKLLNFYLPKIIKKRYVFCWFQRWETLINSLSSGLTSHLSHLLLKEINPTDIYLFKFNNGNTRKRCEICSKLTIKTPKRRQTTYFTPFLVFLLLTLNKWMLAGCVTSLISLNCISFWFRFPLAYTRDRFKTCQTSMMELFFENN